MKKRIYAFTAALLITLTGCANTNTTTDTENVTEILSETSVSETEIVNDSDVDEATSLNLSSQEKSVSNMLKNTI